LAGKRDGLDIFLGSADNFPIKLQLYAQWFKFILEGLALMGGCCLEMLGKPKEESVPKK
jgi:hypothetical protein